MSTSDLYTNNPAFTLSEGIATGDIMLAFASVATFTVVEIGIKDDGSYQLWKCQNLDRAANLLV